MFNRIRKSYFMFYTFSLLVSYMWNKINRNSVVIDFLMDLVSVSNNVHVTWFVLRRTKRWRLVILFTVLLTRLLINRLSQVKKSSNLHPSKVMTSTPLPTYLEGPFFKDTKCTGVLRVIFLYTPFTYFASFQYLLFTSMCILLFYFYFPFIFRSFLCVLIFLLFFQPHLYFFFQRR